MDRSARGNVGKALRPVRAWQAPEAGGVLARRRVCFLYVGQGQRDHAVSTAVELSRRCPELEVEVAATSQAMAERARIVAAALGGAPLGCRLLGPDWLRRLARAGQAPPKLPMLLASVIDLARYDAVVATERTLKVLRALGLPAARLVAAPAPAGPARMGLPAPSVRAAGAVADVLGAKLSLNDAGSAALAPPPNRRTATA